MVGWKPVLAKQLVGQVDNSAYPLLNVNIAMTVVTPPNFHKLRHPGERRCQMAGPTGKLYGCRSRRTGV